MVNLTDCENLSKSIAANSDALLVSAFDHISDMVFIKEAKNLTFIYLNNAGEKILGYTKAQMCGKSDFDFFPKNEAEYFSKTDREVLSSGKMIQIHVEEIETRYGKKYLSTKKIPILNPQTGIPEYLIGISQDISQAERTKRNIEEQAYKLSKLSQQYLDLSERFLALGERTEENENRLRLLMDTIPDIICFKDAKGRWLLANKADLELFELQNVDYYGKTDAELAPYSKFYYDAFMACLDSDELAWQKKSLFQTDEHIPLPNGETKIYDVYKIPVFSEDGSRKGLAVIGRDVTLLRATQEKLRQAVLKATESDKLKSAFLANMSHEIRTPMNGIIGFAELLHNESLPQTQRDTYIEIINQSSKQLLNTVNDILDISRIETGQVTFFPQEIALNEMIASVINEYSHIADRKAIKIFKETPNDSTDLHIFTDSNKLRQVFNNLVSNALKFTESGEVVVRYHVESQKVHIAVSDTGIGIPPEKTEALFKRFSQIETTVSQKYRGTGLGLAIAKANIELAGGEISYAHNKPHGSVFSFTLPYNPINAPKNGHRKQANLNNYKMWADKHILVVEDEVLNFMLIQAYLETTGVRLTHIETGTGALERFKKDLNFDLVLMDIKLPGISGYELTQILRNKGFTAPIIAQTAFTLSVEKETAFNSGCTDHIGKPMSAEDLLTVLKKYL